MSGLVIEGAPGPEAIQKAWLAIYSDYCNQIGGIHIKGLLRRVREVYALSNKIDRITLLVDTARMVPDHRLIEALNEERFKVVYIPEDPQGYSAQLDAVIARLSPLRLRLQTLLKEMPEKKVKEQAVTADTFEETLQEISKHQGYQVPDNITVYRYCVYVQRLRKHAERMIKDKNKAKDK